jgi:hypothetical protein
VGSKTAELASNSQCKDMSAKVIMGQMMFDCLCKQLPVPVFQRSLSGYQPETPNHVAFEVKMRCGWEGNHVWIYGRGLIYPQDTGSSSGFVLLIMGLSELVKLISSGVLDRFDLTGAS